MAQPCASFNAYLVCSLTIVSVGDEPFSSELSAKSNGFLYIAVIPAYEEHAEFPPVRYPGFLRYSGVRTFFPF